MTAIDKHLHAIIVRAQHEAREDDSATIEACHLLLAIAGDPEPTAHELLGSVGLDQRAIRAALKREYERSLRTAGVSSVGYEQPRPSRLPAHPAIGTSAKLALERGLASVARKKDVRPAHVLLGVLSAQFGTLPRALALAGIDQGDLTARIRRTLSGEHA